MKQATSLAVALLFAVSHLFASFHLWEINEIYSSADGSVQFVELFTTADGQNFLGGQSLTITGVGAAAPFTFGANLPASATANHSLLIGTSNLETLYGLVPDYVLPPGFLTEGASSLLDFAGVDSVSLAELPRDGSKSLNAERNDHNADHFGVNENATPTNFAGDTVAIGALADVEGVYRGIVKAQPFAHETSGFVTVSLTAAGKFSASVILAGKRSRLVGKLDASRFFSGTLRSGGVSLMVTLQFDGIDQITGAIGPAGSDAPIGFTLDRAIRVPKGQQAAQTGTYGVLIPADPAQPDHPQGDGFGTARVAANGTVRVVGKLADGARFSQSAALRKNGSWPFYVRLYGGKGEIVGDLTFRDNPQVSDLDGAPSWFRPAIAGSKRFASGFSGEVALIGSSYVPPAKGTRALAFEDAADNGRVAIGDGGLGALVVKVVTLGRDNKVAVTQPANDKLKLKLTAKDGLFTGSFFDVASRKSRKFEGVLFQKQKIASGFFLSDTQSGFVTLARSDDVPNATDIEARTSVEQPAVIDVLAGIDDPDLARFSVESFTQPSHGTVAFVGSVVTYAPANGYEGSDSFTYTVSDGRGGTKTVTVTVLVESSGPVIPPDPATMAPSVDRSVATAFGDATAFLYTGANPVQSNVAPGTIKPLQACVIRGKATTAGGVALPGVVVSILRRPEFGFTVTRADGMFDLAVNGGETLAVKYAKTGFFEVQRSVAAPWQDFAMVDDIVMTAMDPVVTPIEVGPSAPMQVAQGTEQTDVSGHRRATIIFPGGVTASLIMPDGSTQPTDSLHVRATEFTTGPSGPAAMPGELPPSSAYTYCVELSADEAVAAGATRVQFDRRVYLYVENFLNFPIGGIVPEGDFDRTKGVWVPSENGRVLKIVGTTGGFADLDTDGDGAADDAAALAALAVTDDERARLAQLYPAGQALWRVPITHFSSWDSNWPPRLPFGATGPQQPGPNHGHSDDDCGSNGSIINVQNQALGEAFNVTGTPVQLRYNSERVSGRIDPLKIPVSGNLLPPGLKRIELQIRVAGKTTRATFAPEPNKSLEFFWDGKDAYGRRLQGGQPLEIRISYVYGLDYARPKAEIVASFAEASSVPGGLVSSEDSARNEVTLSQVIHDTTGGLDALAPGLGGWSLDIHHSYDVNQRILYLGDGRQRSGQSISDVITSAAGTGQAGQTGVGGPATETRILRPFNVKFAADGSYYFGDANGLLYQVDIAGILRVVASVANDFGNAGTPAITAIAIGPDQRVYFATGLFNQFLPRFIYRVEANGDRTVIAGNGRIDPRTMDVTRAYSGDGGPATEAGITEVLGMTFGPDGCLYIADNYAQRIRKIRSDGTIVTFAGSGLPDSNRLIPSGYSGDGGPATAAQLFGPEGVVFGPDGSLYIADTGNHRIRRVRADGIIETIAGRGGSGQFGGGFSGDGGPSSAAELHFPRGLAFGSNGSLYITDYFNNRVRRIAPDGIISTIAGSETGNQALGDGGPATASLLATPRGIAIAPDDSLIVTQYEAHRVRRVSLALPGVQNGQALIPSSDASEAYLFDAKGRHLRTLDALTGAVKLQFSYNAAGQLQSVADGDGNVMTIERGANSAPVAIVAPGGQRTALSLEANGFLASIANPAQDTVRFTYNADGLMQTLIDPKGQTHSFTYDANGRLIRDEDPTGGFTTLARTETPRGFNISMATGGGAAVTFETERLATGDLRLATVDEHGGRTEVIQFTDGHQTGTYPDGTTVELRRQPEARFGAQALTLESVTTTTPAGVVSTASSTQTVTLTNPADPLSVQTLTTTLTLNGRTTTTTYDAATRTITTTTPAGRQSVTTHDARGRATSLLPDPAMDPITFTYDATGRTVKQQRGGQFWSYAYDAKNRVISRTDALNQQTLYAYDDADRLSRLTTPGGHVFDIGHDANGNRTGITMPSGAPHSFSYNAVDLRTGYTAPGNPAQTRLYNLEGGITQTTLPGGLVIAQEYDAVERIAAVNTPEANTGFAYGDDTERATAITRTPVGGGAAQQLALTYDAGELPTSLTWTGPAQGGYTFTYDADTLPTLLQFSSGADTSNIGLTRDADGLVVGYGPFTITRGGPGGATSQIADDKLASTFTYDGEARLASRTDMINGAQMYKIELTYDQAGRIAQRVETTSSAPATFLYEYDSDSELTKVTRDGTIVEQYAYDANGNRTSDQLNGGAATTSSYDVQDRLIAHGANTYQFNAAGFLTQRGGDTFQYGARGELVQAVVGGTTSTFSYDGLGRRTAVTDAGGTTQYFYGNPGNALQLTTSRGPNGLLSIFFYDDAGVVFSMERGGIRYYLACDQVGSPRIISTGSGTIVAQIEYDAYGRVTLDTNPAFALPIGFAGGLTDTVTGLVHFGFRDYDPASGRWTARDPMLFGGRQANMFAYARNNPVALRDPTGLAVCVGFSAYSVFGAGLQICIAEDGLSVCEETGFGVGGGLEIGTGSLARPGNDIGIDLSASCGPASLSYNATLDHCGDFKHGAKGKAGVGPFSVSLDQDGNVKFGETAKGDGWSAGVDSTGRVSAGLNVSGPKPLEGFHGKGTPGKPGEAKCKLSGKLAGKLCQRF